MKDGASGAVRSASTSLQAAGGTAGVRLDTINDNWTSSAARASFPGAGEASERVDAHYDFDKALDRVGYTNGTYVLRRPTAADAFLGAEAARSPMGCDSGASAPTAPSGQCRRLPQSPRAAWRGVRRRHWLRLRRPGDRGTGTTVVARRGATGRATTGYLGVAMRRRSSVFRAAGPLRQCRREGTATTTLSVPTYRLDRDVRRRRRARPSRRRGRVGGVSLRAQVAPTPTFTRVDTPVGDFDRADGEERQVTPGRLIQPRVVSEVTVRTEAAGCPGARRLITGLSLTGRAWLRRRLHPARHRPRRQRARRPFSETDLPLVARGRARSPTTRRARASADGAGTEA